MQSLENQFLQVSSLHTLRLQISGNPEGVPLILLHGGPGAGIHQKEVEAYDPSYYRIITFDQRGTGQSTPPGETRANTTRDLIADINKIRKHLRIGSFVLAGGSWGTTLALLYAERHPRNVAGLILRATYLNRQQDMDWMYGTDGVKHIYPDHWNEFTSIIPEKSRAEPVRAYRKLINSGIPQVQTDAISLWNEWPPAAHGDPMRLVFNNAQERAEALQYSRIGVHYFASNMFMKDNQILMNIDRIRHIPIEMVHGAQDMIVKPDGALALKQAHPLANLEIVDGCGHAVRQSDLFAALIRAAGRMKTRRLTLPAVPTLSRHRLVIE